MRKSIVLVGLLLLVSAMALAQEPYPKVEVAPEFVYDRTPLAGAISDGPSTSESLNCAGGGGTIAYNVTSLLGFAFDGGYCKFFGNTLGLPISGDQVTFMGGPRFTFRNHTRFTPFFDASFGGDRLSLSANSGPSHTTTAFGLTAGVGFDIKINRRFSLRPIDAQYLYTRFGNACAFSVCSNDNSQNSFQLKSGVVFNFGLPHEVAVSASCSATPTSVDAGMPVNLGVTPSGFSPKRTLRYSYSTTGGKVSGSSIDTTGLAAGSYTVAVTVVDSGSGKNQRTAGCQVSFMVNPMNPPTLSVSASPSSVDAGQSSTITASGSSPDNRPLSYSCTSTAGNLSGAGTHYTLDTTGVQPASSITVNCTVTDDRSLTAAASAGVTINAAAAVVAPPPPPQTEIEEYLKIRSIYFATDKPSVKKPDGGLMPSQEATLAKLASSFKTYLQSKPDATLTLEGHADQRGSVAYNQALSERRVESTKHLLVEQGVPEASIQTKAYGKQHNLTEAEVKNAVEQNPEVSAEDRAKLLKKIKVIQWASNRRVDVTLNIPGKSPQESVQTYPFNAEDSMVLLSPAPPSKKAAATKKK